MKNVWFCFIFILLYFTASSQYPSKFSTSGMQFHQPAAVCFTENKGQIYDQNFKKRPDILFTGTTEGLSYHLRKNGLSYQLIKVEEWKEERLEHSGKWLKIPSRGTLYRLDVNWIGISSTNSVTEGNVLPGYDNFYQSICPEGINEVSSYQDVYYRELYPHINLHFYGKDNHLKYDWEVKPGGNFKNISFEILGASKIGEGVHGELILNTPIGQIIEDAPLVFQNGRRLAARWVVDSNVISFEIDRYNPSLPLIIDPGVRQWGTYYGYSNVEIDGCAMDSTGNVYVAGVTWNSGGIATSGSHQSSFGSTIQFTTDGFLAKFTDAGVRLWATFYGGDDSDYGFACATDGSGNVFLVGTTTSTSAIATSSAHQTSLAAGQGNTLDAFVAKFNAAGVRQWGTYYGSAYDEQGLSCTVDNLGNLYLAGHIHGNNMTTGTIIATAASHQSTTTNGAGFVAKFNPSGVRAWGTFYGSDFTRILCCAISPSNSIYITGQAPFTATGISTSGTHQSLSGGGNSDAFLAKFNLNGVRAWGTYYGGAGDEDGKCCSIDGNDNAIITGGTTSTMGIASSAAQQTLYIINSSYGSGGSTAYLAKFNAAGSRLWGTYQGDNIAEGVSCSTGANNAVYLLGNTVSNVASLYATSGAHQPNFAGGYGGGLHGDAFLTKYSSTGVLDWSTYYGGSNGDGGYSCTADNFGHIYFAGGTTSTNNIATSNAHQTTISSGGGFLVQFYDCNASSYPVNTTPTNTLGICSGSWAAVSASGAGAIQWFSSPTSTLPIGNGAAYVTPLLATGIYTYYAELNGCGPGYRTAVSVTVNPLPTVSVNSGSICSGTLYTLTPSGASSYTYLNGGPLVNPNSTNSYSIIGTSSTGCTNTVPAVATISVFPNATITAANGTICTGSSFQISHSGAYSYSVTGGSFLVNPTVTTSYSVTGTTLDGCRSNTAVCTVLVHTAVPLLSVSPGTVCSGKQFTFSVSGAFYYSFYPAGPIVNPASTTVYTITGTNSPGTCSATLQSTLVVIPLPILSIINGNSEICYGDQITLTALGANTYSWSSGASAPSIVITPLTTSNYQLTGFLNGCSSVLSTQITVTDCLGIDAHTISLSTISVFPNPGRGLLYIKSSDDFLFSLFDTFGTEVYKVHLAKGLQILNLYDLKQGVYFYFASHKDNEISSGKIVIVN
jgi:hypothetical protein